MLTLCIKFFLFITGLLPLSVHAKSLLRLLTDALIMPLFGYKVKSMSFFGLRFESEKNGGWHKVPFKYEQTISHNCGIDLRKPIPEDAERKEKIALYVSTILTFLISCGIAFLFRGSFARLLEQFHSFISPDLIVSSVYPSYLDWLAAGFAVGLVFHSLFSVGTTVYIYAVMMKKLAGYTSSLIKRMRAGEKVYDMALRPASELPYKNPTQIEIMLYNNIYLFYLLLHDNIDAMRPVMTDMTAYFRNQEYHSAQTMNYMWLIFWYSRYDIDPSAAKAFYDRVGHVLENDKDANAKRVLGYYAFGVERDIYKAQRYVNDGLAVIESFSLPGEEREMERKLLNELQGFIDKSMPASQGIPL
ncbi:MAG: hypothetical protein K5695_11900 [Oscillospiraceae bacterium]|nr:hypothetical protein [Oscillospiraceae bacterium]